MATPVIDLDRWHIPFGLVLLALLLAGCARSASTTTNTSAPDPVDVVFADRDPARVVVSIREVGGFVTQESDAARVEAPVLMGDGTVIFLRSTGGGPLRSQLDDATMRVVADLIASLGLPSTTEADIRTLHEPTDSPFYELTYRDESGIHLLRTRNGDALEVHPNAGLFWVLFGILSDPPGDPPTTKHEYEEVQVYVRQVEGVTPARTYPGWPLPVEATELDDSGRGWRCGVFDRLDVVLPSGKYEAYQSGGNTYQLITKPVMPSEEPCRPIVGQD